MKHICDPSVSSRMIHVRRGLYKGLNLLTQRLVVGFVVLNLIVAAGIIGLKSRSSKSKPHETVLITGGLGFIGSHVVDQLVSKGYKVIVYDDQSTGNNFNTKAFTYRGDVSEVNDFEQLDNHTVDYIIHLAAAVSVVESVQNPDKYERINVVGSKTVLDWAIKHRVKRVVAASSAAVYGTPEELPLKEISPLSPISPYAQSKLDMEHLLDKYQREYAIDCIALRFFNVYGPRQNPKSEYSGVVSKFIDSVHNKRNITIFGDGKNTRDFIYVKDVARAIITAMKEGFGFKVYNIGTGVATSLNELAVQIIKKADAQVGIVYYPPRDGDIRYSLADNTKVTTELRWKPKTSLEEGLAETVKWYQEVQAEALKKSKATTGADSPKKGSPVM